MTNNAEKRFANPNSPEGVPSLRIVKVKANTVGEAMDKAEGGAGQAELDWVLANPQEARKMLKGGDFFFFPEAGVDGRVPGVYWLFGKVRQEWRLSEFGWNFGDRVVQLG